MLVMADQRVSSALFQFCAVMCIAAYTIWARGGIFDVIAKSMLTDLVILRVYRHQEGIKISIFLWHIRHVLTTPPLPAPRKTHGRTRGFVYRGTPNNERATRLMGI